MTDAPAKIYSDFEAPKAAGIEYMITLGRRQPMHKGHLRTIEKIMEKGYKPIIVIGSPNGAYGDNGDLDPRFEPVSNPLTATLRHDQIRKALHGKREGQDYFVLEFPDLGDNEKWCTDLVEKLKWFDLGDGRFRDILHKTAYHFIGREEDKRPKRFMTDDGGGEKEVMAYHWEGIFDRLGLPVLHDKPHPDVGLDISGTRLRALDLNRLTDDERGMFATPGLIIDEANRARRENPDGKRLTDAGIAVSAFDLTLERLAREKHITTAAVIDAAEAKGGITADNLAASARELNKSLAPKKIRLKIASASLNQTVYDFSTNVPNIIAAIDKAVADKADILSLEELGLTGYGADDYHQWNKSNDEVWKHIQVIARYAVKKDPNLVISLGTPWHHADKELKASDPEFNINNRPYNTQMTITGGKVVAIAAKSILPDGPGEYESRQFRPWPSEKGTRLITLPDGSQVPFGKPVVALEKDGQRVTLAHEICAEGWPGVNDDLSINSREQRQARYIADLSKTHDLSVVLNPSASKPQPAIDKEQIRMKGLCASGSKYCGAFVYTNFLGSNSGTMAAEGSQIFAKDGKIVHHGQRYTFKDVSYSSAVLDVPEAIRGTPDAVVAHEFRKHEAAFVGKEADFEKVPPAHLKDEEYLRSVSLWLRDYMAKQPWCQGYVIALSGGKDSAYGAVAVSSMVDLEVKENGVEGFFNHFPNLKYKDEVLKIQKEKGDEAAIDAIKEKLLTCVYMPTDISSERTLNAARFLIEGGELDGKHVKGIGGHFYVAPLQRALDEVIIAYSGLNVDKVAAENLPDIIKSFPNKDDFAPLLARVESYRFAHKSLVREINTKAKPELAQLGLDENTDLARIDLADLSKIIDKLPEKRELKPLLEMMRLGQEANDQLQDVARGHITRTIKRYVNASKDTNPALPDYITKNCSREIPTWAKPEKYDITLQNMQARARVPTPWAIGNAEGKIALVTSNESEASLGYFCPGGDGHLGGANPIGGIPKDDVTAGLAYAATAGLAGLKPLESLYYVNKEKPSAELRKLEEGTVEQTDQSDLGFSYAQSKVMEKTLIIDRHTVRETFDLLRKHPLFPHDSVELRDILLKFSKRWGDNQFKRIMAPLAPHVGTNVDPHQAVRTTVLGDHFKTGMAQLSVDILTEKLGGEAGFKARLRMTPEEANYYASVDKDFKAVLLGPSFDTIMDNGKSGALTKTAKGGLMHKILSIVNAKVVDARQDKTAELVL